MEFKNSILSRLFGGKQTNTDEEPVIINEEKPVEENSSLPPPDDGRLELPREHALNQLYSLRTEQAGRLPFPSLKFPGFEGLSETEVERERGHLLKELTAKADARLKNAVPKKKEVKNQEEAEDTEEAPVVMDALTFVYTASDKMTAWLMVFPPVGNGEEITQDMLKDVLNKEGIVFGIDEELISCLPEKEDRYFRLFLAARGKPAVQGEDGYVVELYPRVIKRQFTVDEHDRVDYSSLNLIQNVDKGEVICEAVPPVKGTAGRTVQGREIPCREGKKAVLPKGRNTEISEDGSKLLALCAGHVEFSGRSFQVKTVMEIDGNVDYTSGNINFLGDVHIRGDVCSGFTVRAMGDITVDGVVEAGEVEAGGDLIVVKGIVGDREAVVRAHHDVYTKYLENSTIHIRGNLCTDSILHSEVYCDGEIQVCSGRGTIIGGQIKAARGIEAKIVGSKSESSTFVTLGGQPCADFEREILLKEIDDLEKEMEKLERQPDSPSKMKRISKIRLDLSVDRMKLNQFNKDLDKIKEKLEEQGGSRLKCGIAYPGLVLTIGNETAHLTRETSSCNARLIDGEIKFS